MIGRIMAAGAEGIDIGVLDFPLLADKNIVDRLAVRFSMKAVIGAVDLLRTRRGIQAGQVDVGIAVAVFRQNPDRLAARMSIQVAHENGRQLFLLIEAVHVFQNDFYAESTCGAADMVKMGVENADFLLQHIRIHLAYRADAREHRKIGTASAFLRMLGEPKGLVI